VVLAVVVAAAWWALSRGDPEDLRAELFTNVLAIRDAEIAQQRAFGSYERCGSGSSARERVKGKPAPRAWLSEPDSRCFATLGFEPASTEVRGAYWVDIQPGKGGVDTFTAHGVSDLDGDGNLAHVAASPGEEPRLLGDPEAL
jgi:hypothetical protein